MNEPFKIYCAVYCELRREGQLYLMRRANTGYRDGFWALPSGHVEAGETLEEAICREVKEESGLKISPAQLQFAHAMYRRSDRTYADYLFTCDTWEGEPIITEPLKCDAAQWFNVNNLPEKMPSELSQALLNIAKGNFFSEIKTPGRE